MSKSPPARGDTDQVSGKRQRQQPGRPVCVCAGPGVEDVGIQERWLVAPTSAEDRGAPSSFLSQEGGHGPSDEVRDPGCRPHRSWPHPALSDPPGSCPTHGPSLTQTLGSPQTTCLTLVQMRTLRQRQRQNADSITVPTLLGLLLAPPPPPLVPFPSSPPLQSPQLWNLKAKMKGRTQDTGGRWEPAPALQQLEPPLDCDAPPEVRRALGVVDFMDSGEVGGGATRTGWVLCICKVSDRAL